jgi:hypothetical protein
VQDSAFKLKYHHQKKSKTKTSRQKGTKQPKKEKFKNQFIVENKHLKRHGKTKEL